MCVCVCVFVCVCVCVFGFGSAVGGGAAQMRGTGRGRLRCRRGVRGGMRKVRGRAPLPHRFLTWVFTTLASWGLFVWGGGGVVSPSGQPPIGILLYFNSTYDISAAEVRPRIDGNHWTG